MSLIAPARAGIANDTGMAMSTTSKAYSASVAPSSPLSRRSPSAELIDAPSVFLESCCTDLLPFVADSKSRNAGTPGLIRGAATPLVATPPTEHQTFS